MCIVCTHIINKFEWFHNNAYTILYTLVLILPELCWSYPTYIREGGVLFDIDHTEDSTRGLRLSPLCLPWLSPEPVIDRENMALGVKHVPRLRFI